MATKKELLASLIAAAEAAADWLCDATSGSAQHEMGCDLHAALSDYLGETVKPEARK